MENIRETIQRNCKRLLDKEKTGLTLGEISKKMNVSQTTLQRWKSGENSPEIDNIEKLAKILEVDPWEFYRQESIIKEILPKQTSLMIKNLLLIPDEIYSLAIDLNDPDAEEWEGVKGILDEAIEHKKTKNNGNKNHA